MNAPRFFAGDPQFFANELMRGQGGFYAASLPKSDFHAERCIAFIRNQSDPEQALREIGMTLTEAQRAEVAKLLKEEILKS